MDNRLKEAKYMYFRAKKALNACRSLAKRIGDLWGSEPTEGPSPFDDPDLIRIDSAHEQARRVWIEVGGDDALHEYKQSYTNLLTQWEEMAKCHGRKGK